MTRPILVSACLLGLATRYDGRDRDCPRVREFLAAGGWLPVPVCPEQLAGLPTPRPSTRFHEGDGRSILEGRGLLRDEQGSSMNEVFLRGATETLKIARLAGARSALLKERSPSCGVNRIHRGSAVVAGRGVTAALLAAEGLTLLSEEDLDGDRALSPGPGDLIS